MMTTTTVMVVVVVVVMVREHNGIWSSYFPAAPLLLRNAATRYHDING
jgi:hypothetical protein